MEKWKQIEGKEKFLSHIYNLFLLLTNNLDLRFYLVLLYHNHFF